MIAILPGARWNLNVVLICVSFSGTSDKRLITTIIQGTQKTKFLKKINEQLKKWTNELNRAFSKEEIQMAKKNMKKCSTFLHIFPYFFQ
jgi:predicted Zn-dependent peptidase